MTEYVYGDVLFVINFSMDFICLFISGKLSHIKIRAWRIILGAALGAIYGVLSLTYSLPVPIEIIIEVAAAAAVCAVALWNGKAVKLLIHTALFYGASVLLGGIMTFVYSKLGRYRTYIETGGSIKTALGDIPIWVFALCAAASAVLTKLLSVLLKKKNAQKTCRLTIVIDGKKLEMTGFVDSGNVCSEPISGTPVIFISSKFGAVAQSPILQSTETLKKGIYAVPVTTVSGTGLVFAVKPEKCMIGSGGNAAEKNALVASGDREEYCGCDALVPLELL